jgi:hypothetical protein
VAEQPVPVGEDAPVFAVMATMRAMRRLFPTRCVRPVARRSVGEVVHRDRW